MPPKLPRDCPACGCTFGSVIEAGVCPECNFAFRASPTQIALAGTLGKHSAHDLLAAIARYHNVPYLEGGMAVCAHAASKVPEAVAREHCVIPLVVAGEVRFATPDPLGERLDEELTRCLAARPLYAVAAAERIQALINEFYGVVGETSYEEIFPLS